MNAISRRFAVRIGLVIVLACLVAGGGYFVAVTPPTPDSVYPKCVVHTLTGLYCPGCGTGRATHFLLRGQPITAFQYNLFAPVALPILAFVLLRALVGWALDWPASNRQPCRAFWLWLLLASLIVYTVARNIPVEPFSRLAPKEIDPAIPSTRP